MFRAGAILRTWAFINNMSTKKVILQGLLAGLVIFIASMLVSQIFKIVFPSVGAEYQNLNLFRAYSDPLMLLFFVYPFLLGVILAWFWEKVKNVFGTDVRGGVNFGIAYWIVSTIPGMFVTYSSMPYSLLIVISWLAEGLVSGILAGIIFAKLENKIK